MVALAVRLALYAGRAARVAVTFDRSLERSSNRGEKSMSFKQRLAACAAFVCLSLTGVSACADDHPYSEGPVVNVSSIRTANGKFEEYMKFLDTTWKATQEAGKKAGYILSYEVMTVEARSENDPDIYLVITYKNWAALDGLIAKGDEISKAVEGSVDAANKGFADRDKIRRTLGSQTRQVLNLK
jgi:hypothetical protein